MTELQITCLGEFQVTLAGTPLTLFQTDKNRALLPYLALEAGVHQRTELAQLLWPGYSDASARNSLRQTLHQLRQTLADPTGVPWFLLTRQTVQLNPDAPITVDVLTFRQLLASCASHVHVDLATCAPCLARLRQAVDLYRGDFLTGFTVADSDPFEEWRRITQEQLHIQMLDALTQLATAAEAAGDEAQARQAAHRLLTLEPWQEAAHRQIMRLLARRGQQAAALAQYQRCRQVLAEELGIEPDAETTALYAQIRAGGFDKVARRQGDKETSDKLTQDHPVTPLPGHNLPGVLPPLIGRAQALAEITGWLQMPETRLLTLVGPGGMGKTSLALAAGRAQLPLFADGVWFVPLAALNTSAALTPAIANALGVSLQGGDPRSTLLQALRPKQMLLLLDNFEHLLTAEATAIDLVVELLEAAPRVQILVTSRERLNLRSEQVYTVQPLPFADSATLDEAAALPAVRLFVQATQRSYAAFQLTAGNLAAVLRICRLVQGMPLGLELAAANAGSAPLNAIADAIAESAEFLRVDWRDMPQRQRSMRAVFAWSWQLLSAAEQHILRQSAIFRGGFTYAAAQQVIGATLPLLTRLTDKSLLQWQTMAPSEGRYAMHELLRQFAAEELLHEEPEKSRAIRLRYAQYYLPWISQQTAKIPANQHSSVIAELQHELENCRQAWALAVQARWIDLIAVGLRGFVYLWRKTGRLIEGAAMLGDAIQALAHTADHTPLLHSTLTLLLVEQATLLHAQGDFKPAIDVARLAIQKAEEEADALALVRALLILARSANQNLDSTVNSITVGQQALALARQHGLDEWEAEALICLASLHYGDLAQQVAMITAALHIAQHLPDLDLEIRTLSVLGGTFENHGQYARSLPYRQKVLELAAAHVEPRTLFYALLNCAAVYGFLGCYTDALALLQQAQAKAHLYKLDLFAIQLARDIAQIYRAMGEVEQAHQLLVSTLNQAANDPLRIQLLEHNYARSLADRGELIEARQIAQRLLFRLRRQVGDASPHLLRCLSLLAHIYHRAGARTEALTHVETIMQILADHPQIDISAVNWELFAIYLTCYEILQQANDPRASIVLKNGYEMLQSQAAQIDAPELRHSFLENILVHRQLVAAWQADVGMNSTGSSIAQGTLLPLCTNG